MWRRLALVRTGVSEISVFSRCAWVAKVLSSLIFSPWWWRWYAPPKDRLIQEPHEVKSKKTALYTITFQLFLICDIKQWADIAQSVQWRYTGCCAWVCHQVGKDLSTSFTPPLTPIQRPVRWLLAIFSLWYKAAGAWSWPLASVYCRHYYLLSATRFRDVMLNSLSTTIAWPFRYSRRLIRKQRDNDADINMLYHRTRKIPDFITSYWHLVAGWSIQRKNTALARKNAMGTLAAAVKIFKTIFWKIWGFDEGDYEELRLLGCNAVWLL
jgi:hypothetical protein